MPSLAWEDHVSLENRVGVVFDRKSGLLEWGREWSVTAALLEYFRPEQPMPQYIEVGRDADGIFRYDYRIDGRAVSTFTPINAMYVGFLLCGRSGLVPRHCADNAEKASERLDFLVEPRAYGPACPGWFFPFPDLTYKTPQLYCNDLCARRAKARRSHLRRKRERNPDVAVDTKAHSGSE